MLAMDYFIAEVLIHHSKLLARIWYWRCTLCFPALSVTLALKPISSNTSQKDCESGWNSGGFCQSFLCILKFLKKKIMRIQKKERCWCILAEGLMLLQ